MNKPLKYIILSIIGIVCSEYLYSQAMVENFDDYRIQPNQDTIVISNNVGSLWVGPLIGLNAEIYYNSLTTLKFPGIPENPFNTRLDFTKGQDLGWFAGAFIEYMPPGKLLAYGARVYARDYRNSSSEMVQQMDLSEYKYQYSAIYKYVSLIPYVKYNFPIEGLYATAGLSVDFPYSNQASLIHIRLDDALITHDLKMSHEQMKIRYGVEIGAGWEFTVNDINDKVRVRFNPYLTASAGTKILSDLNSNWNNVLIKLGFAIKFSFNEITLDTLKYNIESVTKPEIYALVSTPKQVFFEVAGLSESLPAYELDATKQAEPFIQVALEGSMGRINSGTAINPVSELPGTAPAGFGEANKPLEIINTKQEEVLKLEFGEKNTKKLVYSRSKDVNLTDEMKKYLDVIIAYSKTKAIREIYIFGYTEELGSRQKNLDVSKQRAEVAYKYLIKAGVGKKIQIYKDGKGALVPVIEAGKRADVKLNNRIEILIK